MDFLLHKTIGALITLIVIIIGGGLYSHRLQKKLIKTQQDFQARKLRIELISTAICDIIASIHDCAWWLAELKNNQPEQNNSEELNILRNFRKRIHHQAALFPDINAILASTLNDLKNLYKHWHTYKAIPPENINTCVNKLWKVNKELQAYHWSLLTQEKIEKA